jgi:hypothetical protein
MTHSSHTHVCATCGATYDCEGEWVEAEQADGYLKAVCYFFHLQGIDKCGPCENKRGELSMDLHCMLANPHFGVIRRFSEDDWMVVFDEPVAGRHWRGTSLADVVQKWRDQYDAA